MRLGEAHCDGRILEGWPRMRDENSPVLILAGHPAGCGDENLLDSFLWSQLVVSSFRAVIHFQFAIELS